MKTPMIHLQGIGDCYAVPAMYAKVEDRLIWNFGPDRGPITGIFHVSPHYFRIETEGSDFIRRLKTTRPVCVQSLHQTYTAERKATLSELRKNGPDNGSLIGINDAIAGYERLLAETPPIYRLALAELYGQRDAFYAYIRQNYTAFVLAKTAA